MNYLYNPLPHSGIRNIVKAKDEYYYTSDDKKYIDLESGIWCASLGHNHDKINKIIIEHINTLSHISKRVLPTNLDSVAKKIVGLANIKGKVIFLNTGSEAIEFSIITAKQVYKDAKVISFSNNYLAAYGQASKPDVQINIDPCLKCKQAICADDCKVIKDKIVKNCIFIFDPFCFSRRVIIPPQKLIKRIEKEVKLKQGIIIVDEITTGLGRTGKWFGYNHFNLKPDIVVLGKSLGNGYPVSAVIIDNWMIKKNEESGFMHYQSHQNDPLGCKIAEGVLNEIREENLVQNSKELGFLFLNILKEELEPISSIEDIRGIGLLIGIQVKPDIKVEDIYNNLAKKGIIIGISITYNMLNIVPPYTMDKELIPTIAGKIKESIFETITN